MFMNSALTRGHHPTSILPLRPALKERNIGDVERHLYDVSQPKSALCGKHRRPEGVVRTFAPSDGTADITIFQRCHAKPDSTLDHEYIPSHRNLYHTRVEFGTIGCYIVETTFDEYAKATVRWM